MKSINDFFSELSQNQAFLDHLSQSSKTLSKEEVADIFRIVLTLLKEYSEWSQQALSDH